MRIDADAGPARRVIRGDAPRRRHERVRILGVDPAFDRVAAAHDVALPERELLAGRDADLLLHDVDAGDHLGHRMLDLDARVHLDEEELVVLVQELERAGAAIADLAARFGAALADARQRAQRLIPGAGASSMIFWWRRCIEQSRSNRYTAFLCSSASTWISMWRGLSEELLHVHGRIAERRLRLGARQRHGRQQRRLGMHDAHAAAAAAAGRLDDHRIADRARDLDDLLRVVGQRAFGARARTARRPWSSRPWR